MSRSRMPSRGSSVPAGGQIRVRRMSSARRAGGVRWRPRRRRGYQTARRASKAPRPPPPAPVRRKPRARALERARPGRHGGAMARRRRRVTLRTRLRSAGDPPRRSAARRHELPAARPLAPRCRDRSGVTHGDTSRMTPPPTTQPQVRRWVPAMTSTAARPARRALRQSKLDHTRSAAHEHAVSNDEAPCPWRLIPPGRPTPA